MDDLYLLGRQRWVLLRPCLHPAGVPRGCPGGAGVPGGHGHGLAARGTPGGAPVLPVHPCSARREPFPGSGLAM